MKSNSIANVESKAILTVAMELSGPLDMDVIMQRILVQVTQWVGTTFTAVYQQDKLYTLQNNPTSLLVKDVNVHPLLQVNQPVIIADSAKESVWNDLLPNIGLSGLLLPLFRGTVVGLLVLGSEQVDMFNKEDIQRLEPFTKLAGNAIGTVLRHKEATITIRLQERRQLAQQVHDTASQTIYAANTMAELLPRMVEKNPQKANEYMQELQMLTKAAMADIRILMIELHPETIQQTEFNLLLNQLCDSFTGRTRILVTYQGTTQLFLPPKTQMICYRIVQEMLMAIAKHAQVTAVAIHLEQQENKVEVHIEDNGHECTLEDIATQTSRLESIQNEAKDVGVALHIDTLPEQDMVITVAGVVIMIGSKR